TDEASDDGLVHWVAGARPPANPWPGDNPYCFGCWTSPVPLSLAPQPVAFIGYGAVNNETVAHAAAVLAGLEPMPERPDEDAFFAADRVVRGATG
ncbi:MAG TPA: hypothetical protein VI796_02655, partial [Candidatus Thermoplasmatota archaeon]|nr:hypothetical protein [Candidatus Thermoplasmatota archaeon]